MANEPGHWVCHRQLGAGGFGIVQLWKNDYTNELIAIKKCKHDNYKLTKKQKERWINEVQTMMSLQHPNVVRTRSPPSQLQRLQEPLPVLCMEYCSSGDLRMLLNKPWNCCGIEEREAYKIMHDVASAVEYLHSCNYTHRDLKPDNIVIQRCGEKVTYKLTDLGYVCELGDMTIEGSIVGTLNYLAPEIFWKNGYTCSVDYWSLGILFYEIITGNRPFFPDMHVGPPAWIDHLKRKSDSQISAKIEDGTVSFSEEIENPTTMSECMRAELTAWFRLVLQWDPKKRGKIKDSEGCEHVVVFSTLKSLLSRKIIQVFVTPLYRLDSYVISPETSVADLQSVIFEKTGIEVCKQIVSDTKCNVFKDPNALVLNCMEGSHLIVLHMDGPQVIEAPRPLIPAAVHRIMENRKVEDPETIDRYYSAAVFFIGQGLELFRNYVIALSIHIDLNNMAVDDCRGFLNGLRGQADGFITELSTFAQSPEYERMTEQLSQKLNLAVLNTEAFVRDVEDEKLRIDALTKEFENLNKISEISLMKQWTALYEKATDLLESVRKANRMQPRPLKDIAKLVFHALKLPAEQLRCPEMDCFVRRIVQYNRRIEQLQNTLHSFKDRIDQDRKHFEEISKREIQAESALPMISTETVIHDTCDMIHDNIVLSQLLESLSDFYSPIDTLEDFNL